MCSIGEEHCVKVTLESNFLFWIHVWVRTAPESPAYDLEGPTRVNRKDRLTEGFVTIRERFVVACNIRATHWLKHWHNKRKSLTREAIRPPP